MWFIGYLKREFSRAPIRPNTQSVTDVPDQELAEALDHHRNGRLEDAARGYESILTTRPTDFEALFYLSQVRAAQNRADEAFSLMHAAASQRPDSAEAQYRLGVHLMALRRPNQAIVHFRQATALRPGHAAALDALGSALRSTDRLEEAELCYRNAIVADPQYVPALRHLGTLLSALERPGEGLPYLERAIAVAPQDAELYAAAAGVLRKLNRWKESLAHCDTALELDPDLAEAYANRGDVELELGMVADAKQDFARATELAPDAAQFLCRVVSIERIAHGDPRLNRLEEFARDTTLFKEERIRVYFTLGKAYADAGQHERSFEQLARGNALQRGLVSYDERATLAALALTAAVFTPEFVAARRGWGFPSRRPIFIVGMPRSGTTLIEQILASHPRVHAGGELEDFASTATAVLAKDARSGIDAASMQAADPAAIAEVGRRYVDAVARLAPEALHVTDKMPVNSSYVGLIHLALPNARIIHARRDPVDNCLSCFSLLFAQGQSFSYDLGELGRYYRAYETLMDHWRAILPPGTVLDVQYEEVVNDFEAQARRIVAFCGLEWDDACLRFYETKRPVRTASLTQVRQPIYQTSVGRWKPYAHLLTPLLQALGLSPPLSS